MGNSIFPECQFFDIFQMSSKRYNTVRRYLIRWIKDVRLGGGLELIAGFRKRALEKMYKFMRCIGLDWNQKKTVVLEKIEVNSHSHFSLLQSIFMFFDVKKHLTSCIFKKNGNMRRGTILRQIYKFFFCSMEEDPITPVVHIIFGGI